MSNKANPTAIGLFVTGAVIILVAGILVLGSGQFFQETQSYVLHFEGDLNGLDVGAPITLRGVKIGEVEKISIVYDHASDSVTAPVIIKLLRSSFTEINADQTNITKENIKEHVKNGLRARLETLSLVTGKLRINLAYNPDHKAVYRDVHTGLPEIPTMPTTLQSVAKQISELPITEIVEDLNKTMAAVSTFFSSDRLETTFDELNTTIAGLSGMIQSEDVQQTIRAMNETLAATQALINEVRQQTHPLQRELGLALEELADTARVVQDLVEYLGRHPEALIQGKGKQP